MRAAARYVALAACARPASPTPSPAGSPPTDASAGLGAASSDDIAELTKAAIAQITREPAATSSRALDAPELAATVTRLARAVLARAPEPADEEEAWQGRALLHVAAGDHASAAASLSRMRQVATRYDPAWPPVLFTQYELFARARLAEASTHTTFAAAFAHAFRERFARLDDVSAEHALWRPDTKLDDAVSNVTAAVERARTKSAGPLVDAADLAAQYAAYVIRRDILPLTAALQAEDIARRYDVDDDVRITTRDGATISAIVVRPRAVTAPAPVALSFTIYTNVGILQAIAPAAHGYASVLAYTRGKRASTGEVVPYEHEARDTYDTIDWISKQRWCDGKVGMFGGSYGGFTAWAATKHLHPALKTIVPYVAAIPGQGLPMENNVFLNANYGWAFYVANGPGMDDAVYSDRHRWSALADAWFQSGRPYREIDAVDGAPNRLLQRWLAHPSYDAYWQAMVPYEADFAKLDIPVLSFTGYYDDGQISALRYFTEHTKRNPKNNQHHLIIGPYDHFAAQRRAPATLRGYTLDPVARIDTPYITFQWLDHVLRGAPPPPLVTDRVNFEVMGANQWRHAASLDKMHDDVLTLYLDDHHLASGKPSGDRFLTQVVDLADRKTQNDDYYPDPIVRDELDAANGLVFVGEPLERSLSIDGMFSGELHVTIDKRDMDVGAILYERTPNGTYVSLSYYLGRASYARDMTRRRLLTPGQVESIPFDRTRMVSRRLAKGSQLVVVLNVNKNPGAQVNHGTGKDVSDESAAAAKTPLHVQWHGDSFVRIPVSF